jgi:hypothetical protein
MSSSDVVAEKTQDGVQNAAEFIVKVRDELYQPLSKQRGASLVRY